MKKVRIPPVMLCLLLTLFTPLTAAAQEYYRSNSLGMALEPISELRRSEHAWVLARRVDGKRVSERLYHKGRQLRRTVAVEEADEKRVEVWQGGELRRRLVESAGLPRTEIEYTATGASLRREYLWRRGRLRELRLYEDGALQELRRYATDAYGRLLHILRLRPDGRPLAVTGFQPGRESPYPASEWHAEESRSRYYRYDDTGRLLLTDTGGEAERRVTEYFRRDGQLHSRTKLPQSGSEVLRKYDEQRRIVEKLTRREGETERERFFYQAGRLVRRTLRSRGERRAWSYAYGEEGRLLSREFRMDGVLRSRTEYGEEERRTVTVYHDGKAALRLLYAGEELLERRELIREEEQNTGRGESD